MQFFFDTKVVGILLIIIFGILLIINLYKQHNYSIQFGFLFEPSNDDDELKFEFLEHILNDYQLKTLKIIALTIISGILLII